MRYENNKNSKVDIFYVSCFIYVDIYIQLCVQIVYRFVHLGRGRNSDDFHKPALVGTEPRVFALGKFEF